MRLWIEAARPKTLVAGAAPVLYGALPAFPHINWLTLFYLLVAALAFQIAANYANDYYDAIQGADTLRTAFRRLTASGLISPAAMKRAYITALAIANLCALLLGGIAIPFALLFTAAAVGYTRGKKSLAYSGFGEIAVFILFGLIGTNLAAYLLSGHTAFLLSLIPGFLSTALLLLNNIRDVETDRAVDKKTLAVRFGLGPSKALYILCIAGAALLPLLIKPLCLLATLALLPAIPLIRGLLTSDDLRPLPHYFVKTARMQLLYTLIFAFTYLC